MPRTYNRYHISRDGVRRGCAAASVESCRAVSPEGDKVHFDTPEECDAEILRRAGRGQEAISMLKKARKPFDPASFDEGRELEKAKLALKYDHYDNTDSGISRFLLKRINEWDRSDWTDEERENLMDVNRIVELVADEKPTPRALAKAKKLLDELHPEDSTVNYGSYGRLRVGPNNDERRDRNIIKLGELSYLQAVARTSEGTAHEAPKRESNDGLLGIRATQLDVLKKFNEPGYEFMEGRTVYGDSVYEHFDKTIDRIVAGEDPDDLEHESGYGPLVVPASDRLMKAIRDNQGLYISLVMPERELKDEMQRAGVTNVSTSAFNNSREYGNVYTVMTPDGGTRSFSLYEHRNSDSIIINGTTNWDGEALPYGGETKNHFFAEIPVGQYTQASRTLTYFLKSAQEGTLEDDAYLMRNAPRVDWGEVLGRTVPGFRKWFEENMPAEAARNSMEGDEAVLERLDFESDSEH